MATTHAVCPRSLGETLISAASTAAFIAAANFSFSPNISSKSGTLQRWFQCIKMGLGEPFRAFAHSLISVAITWYTLRLDICKGLPIAPRRREEAPVADGRSSRWKEFKQWWKNMVQRTGLVAIMLNCPILIPIPPEFPVEVAPAMGDSANKKKACACIKVPMGSMDDASNKKKASHKVTIKNPPNWMKDLKISQNIDGWNPLELPLAQPAAGPREVASLAHAAGEYSSHPPLYIKLHPSYWHSSNIQDRQLLLKLKLVPAYEQVRYLRSRSTFEAVVTTVQSLGYMLGVGQRIVTHYAVSPLEAIMAYFNLLIVLQYILNLYSCVHYQRPLLLHLSPQQFQWYADEKELLYANKKDVQDRNSNDTARSSLSGHRGKRQYIFLVIGSLISVALYTLVQFAFIHYALSYLHHCILCSLSTFFICFLALSALILIGMFIVPGFREFWKELNDNLRVHYALRICTSIITTSSLILALVATIIRWDKFKEPTKSLLQWIVPFVNG